ncbi:MAG: hypothetical protein ABIW94_01570 [Gemmatimonadaceae bacterium]
MTGVFVVSRMEISFMLALLRILPWRQVLERRTGSATSMMIMDGMIVVARVGH